jgi:hypothetical protein
MGVQLAAYLVVLAVLVIGARLLEDRPDKTAAASTRTATSNRA